MKQSKDYTLLALAIPVAIALLFHVGLSNEIKAEKMAKAVNTGHTCEWSKCPYKSVPMADRKEAIIEYTGCEEATDCYCIDWLHFEYPKYQYDQLDSLLFAPNTPIN